VFQASKKLKKETFLRKSTLMTDLYPLFAVVLTLSVFVACYCRIKLRRRNRNEIEYMAIPAALPSSGPKPSAPPMIMNPEEESDPIV
jgi:hypothetical protein